MRDFVIFGLQQESGWRLGGHLDVRIRRIILVRDRQVSRIDNYREIRTATELIRGINRLQTKPPENAADAPPPPEDVVLLREIRDLLKSRA